MAASSGSRKPTTAGICRPAFQPGCATGAAGRRAPCARALAAPALLKIACSYKTRTTPDTLLHDCCLSSCAGLIPQAQLGLGQQPTFSRLENAIDASRLYLPGSRQHTLSRQNRIDFAICGDTLATSLLVGFGKQLHG